MTVIGACTTAPVVAEPGDVLAIAAAPGRRPAGSAVLGRGFRSPRVLVEAYRRPEPPHAGRTAADAGATSMIDVSDGLVADAGHLAAASGVAIDVRTGRSRSPSRGARSGRRWARTPSSSSSAAATTTPCSRRTPTRPRAPAGWRRRSHRLRRRRGRAGCSPSTARAVPRPRRGRRTSPSAGRSWTGVQTCSPVSIATPPLAKWRTGSVAVARPSGLAIANPCSSANTRVATTNRPGRCRPGPGRGRTAV